MKKILLTLMVCSVMLTAFAGGGDNDKPKSKNIPMKIRKRTARPDIPGTFLIELGVNFLQDAPKQLDIKPFGSKTVNLYYYYDIPIGKTKFVFMPGLGLGLDRYKFDEAITLSSSKPDTIFPLDTVSSVVLDTLNGGIKKSLLIANYVDIPIEFRFYTNPDDKKRSFHVGIGGKIGIRYSSHTKIKTDSGTKIKLKDDFGLNRFRYGVSARVGIGGFNLFGYYALSELFESKKGPLATKATNFTVGLSFTGF